MNATRLRGPERALSQEANFIYGSFMARKELFQEELEAPVNKEPKCVRETFWSDTAALREQLTTESLADITRIVSMDTIQ